MLIPQELSTLTLLATQKIEPRMPDTQRIIARRVRQNNVGLWLGLLVAVDEMMDNRHTHHRDRGSTEIKEAQAARHTY